MVDKPYGEEAEGPNEELFDYLIYNRGRKQRLKMIATELDKEDVHRHQH